jgi:hypothetical protein
MLNLNIDLVKPNIFFRPLTMFELTNRLVTRFSCVYFLLGYNLADVYILFSAGILEARRSGLGRARRSILGASDAVGAWVGWAGGIRISECV